MPALTHQPDVIGRHALGRVAFQFSGGRDSSVALFLLRDWWGRMTVYWLDSGDTFPETAAFVRQVGRQVTAAGGRIVQVSGAVHDVIAQYGPPADVIAADSTALAHSMGVGHAVLLQDRAACCARSKMAPLHQRMLDDGITLIIRGQKDCDAYKGPFRSGDVIDGLEFYHPIEGWSDSDVMAWAIDHDCLPPLYAAGLQRSGDCMRCSAWLGDTRAEYLARHHPVAFADYAQRVRLACGAAESMVGRMYGETARIAAAQRIGSE